MTDNERDILSKQIDDLQAANELTVQRLRELELDTLRQRTRRKLHADPFYQRSMRNLDPWIGPEHIRLAKWITGLFGKSRDVVK